MMTQTILRSQVGVDFDVLASVVRGPHLIHIRQIDGFWGLFGRTRQTSAVSGFSRTLEVSWNNRYKPDRARS